MSDPHPDHPDDDIREAAALIAQHFGVPDEEVRGGEGADPLAAVTAFLARQLVGLLRGDLGRLTQILYRMDVSERLADEAFRQPSLEDVAARLAELIIERQRRTVALRRQLGEPDPEEP